MPLMKKFKYKIMEEIPIELETAILAKEKGFEQNPYVMKNSYCPTYNDGSGVSVKNSLFSPENNIATAPTQSQLKKWLREGYNIDVSAIINDSDDNNIYYYYNIVYFDIMIKNRRDKCKFFKGIFKTYEEALEEGLQETLKLIV